MFIKGTMDFYVRVDDVDPIESLVARFLVPVNATPTGNNSVISTTAYRDIQNQGQFIRVEFQLSCAINFFGENCSCACQGRDDNGGHYMCNNDCGINCMQGFRDPLTNCTRCVLAEGCCKWPWKPHAWIICVNVHLHHHIFWQRACTCAFTTPQNEHGQHFFKFLFLCLYCVLFLIPHMKIFLLGLALQAIIRLASDLFQNK